MKITGACHCGEITYEAEVDPDNIVICHCTDCQVLSGTSYRSVAISELDGFEFKTGEAKVYVKTAESGNRREQTFCANCGTPFYAAAEGDGPKRYNIRLGSVNERDLLVPKKQLWCQSAQSWVQDISSLPKNDKQ